MRWPGQLYQDFSVLSRVPDSCEIPSTLNGSFLPSASAIVGSRSTCSQFASLVLPFVWPGSFMNIGTQATWA